MVWQTPVPALPKPGLVDDHPERLARHPEGLALADRLLVFEQTGRPSLPFDLCNLDGSGGQNLPQEVDGVILGGGVIWRVFSRQGLVGGGVGHVAGFEMNG
jgi:hypothetical protein